MNSVGEGLAIPTDPHHIPTILQSSSSQPQKTYKPRKLTRKVTEVPQPSNPLKHVADEAVYKELDDRLVRTTTTVSNLEVEQDRGKINKTQSKATPNKSSSQGNDLGGGPRCQDTMGDTITQTRSERVFKLSNDSLLAKGNILQSDEDRLKLNELMELCTTLQSRVLDLEKTKTTQALEIDNLKRRVKKLKKKQRSRTHKLKRLYKVGLSARVKYTDDNEHLVFVEKDADREVNDEVQKVVKEEGENINTAELIVDAAQVNAASEVTAASITTIDSAAATITIDEVTMAQALMKIKSTKPKAKGLVLQDPSESRTTTTISSKKSQDKGKAKIIKEPLKLKKKDQIMLDEEVVLKLQAYLQDKEKRLANFRTELVEESSKKAEAEVMGGSLKRANEEGVAIDVIPLAVKAPSIVDWKIHKEGKKSYYQVIRVDGSSKIYLVFCHMLKCFNKKDVKSLWKLVKAKHGSIRPEEGYERVLWGDLKVIRIDNEVFQDKRQQDDNDLQDEREDQPEEEEKMNLRLPQKGLMERSY
nr:hypothetical protein [Tanacetum cinerariifolium]